MPEQVTDKSITLSQLGRLWDRGLDAFGEVSPCVFTPMTFGNVREASVKSLFLEMKTCFHSSDSCFINTNFELFRKYAPADQELNKEQALTIMREACFGQLPEFFKIYDK